jgi:hypothetical protein
VVKRSLHFTLSKLLSFALGELGLEEEKFNKMSWEDYCYKSHGYFIRQSRQWEHTRSIMWVIFNANCHAKHQKKSPEDLFPLLTDVHSEKDDSKVTSKMDMAERMYKARKVAEEMNKQALERWKQGLK